MVHPDGYLEVRDRGKDIVISGGENISSIEVEKALYDHPAVLEAAIVARPDDKWGEVPKAYVTLKPGCDGVRGGTDRILPRAAGAFQVSQAGRVRTAAEDRHRQNPQERAARAHLGGAREARELEGYLSPDRRSIRDSAMQIACSTSVVGERLNHILIGCFQTRVKEFYRRPPRMARANATGHQAGTIS